MHERVVKEHTKMERSEFDFGYSYQNVFVRWLLCWCSQKVKFDMELQSDEEDEELAMLAMDAI